jgi:hypothetical protein
MDASMNLTFFRVTVNSAAGNQFLHVTDCLTREKADQTAEKWKISLRADLRLQVRELEIGSCYPHLDTEDLEAMEANPAYKHVLALCIAGRAYEAPQTKITKDQYLSAMRKLAYELKMANGDHKDSSVYDSYIPTIAFAELLCKRLFKERSQELPTV